MAAQNSNKYIFLSAAFHLGVLLVLVLTLEFASPLIVVENTNKQDVISAVVLGESAKSKILPQKAVAKPVVPEPIKKVIEPKPEPIVEKKTPVVEKAIALKPIVKKKPEDIFGKDLLADIAKIKKKVAKKKKERQKQLDAQFQKTLRESAEKSMRRNLLNEDIQLKSTEVRASQGVVNKYQALIQQAISEHWVIPPQTNKKLSSILTIRLAPGGLVLDVQITKSSGDRALDSSARAAVLKASPLPVPKESADFEPFRQFTLKVKPENIQNDTLTG